MLEESERRIPDINGVLEDAVKKKNATLGVMSSSSFRGKLGHLLYLQDFTRAIPVTILVDNGASISFILCKIFKLLRKSAKKSKRVVSLLKMGVNVILKASLMLPFPGNRNSSLLLILMLF